MLSVPACVCVYGFYDVLVMRIPEHFKNIVLTLCVFSCLRVSTWDTTGFFPFMSFSFQLYYVIRSSDPYLFF